MKTTERFSNRVDDYSKYRPGYPESVLRLILENGFTKYSVVADVGSGTGIFSQLLLSVFSQVYGIEPNTEMRKKSISALAGFSGFQAINSTAEKINLKDTTIDVITIAQAFHWLNAEKCKIEFGRILKPNGKVFLIWNSRLRNTSFLEQYDELLLELGTDYKTVNHQFLDTKKFDAFFDSGYEKKSFPNYQEFSLEGFLGRVFSSSYTPTPQHKDYAEFKNRLIELFNRENVQGKVRFNYSTDVYYGKV